MLYTVISCPEIITMDETRPTAEAACVFGGKILALGSLEDMRALAAHGPHEELRFEEGVLLPGFIDSHSHLSMYAQCRTQFFCDTAYRTIAAMLDAFRAHAAAHPDAEWVMGYCYDDTGLDDQRHLTRHDLDAVSTERPVFVSHITSHMGYANTLGLQLLGVTADMKVAGGEVVLDADGQPQGLLKENAYFQIAQKIPATPAEQLPDLIEQAVADYNRAGFTMFQDGGISLGGGAHAILRAYTRLAREQRLNARGYLHFMANVMDEMLEYGTWSLPLSDHLFFGGVKAFADGSIQALTALLGSPYTCKPGYCGDEVVTQEQIADFIVRHHAKGVPVAVHANGDAAIEYVVRGFERALREYPERVPGHMIIHAQMASDEQLARLHACGVTPTFFVQHVRAWGERHVKLFLGPERSARLDPCGSCVRMGIPFALHVDSPVQPVGALISIHTAVNRTTSAGRVLGPDQRVSTLDAIKAYTVNAAKCTAREHVAGKLAPGYYADFVQLDKNPLRVPKEELERLQILRTISGGHVVYEA